MVDFEELLRHKTNSLTFAILKLCEQENDYGAAVGATLQALAALIFKNNSSYKNACTQLESFMESIKYSLDKCYKGSLEVKYFSFPTEEIVSE